MLTLSWVKCGNAWCPLETVDLSKTTTKGVYVIWHAGNPGRVVRIGQGDVADRLYAHRNDGEILAFAKYGTLRATWAVVSVAQRDGVERYLGEVYPPLIGDAFPDVVPIAVNSPW